MRVEKFNMRYPHEPINLYVLRKIYQQYMIRNKKIQKKKSITIRQEPKIEMEAKEAKKNLNEAKQEGYKIYYVDEFCTTRNTFLTHSWSLKNQPFQLEQNMMEDKMIASILCISEEDGVNLLMNFPKSVNSTKFIEFLRELRSQQPEELIAIFMDRLNVHRSYRVLDVCQELGIIRIFNSSYSPNYNPIEGVIGVIKNEIKR